MIVLYPSLDTQKSSDTQKSYSLGIFPAIKSSVGQGLVHGQPRVWRVVSVVSARCASGGKSTFCGKSFPPLQMRQHLPPGRRGVEPRGEASGRLALLALRPPSLVVMSVKVSGWCAVLGQGVLVFIETRFQFETFLAMKLTTQHVLN